MKNLFEYNDILRSPIEAFSCSSETFSMPVVSHWHYFTEVLYLQEGSLLVSCNDVVYPMEAGSFILFPPQAVHALAADHDKPFRFLRKIQSEPDSSHRKLSSEPELCVP